VNVSTSDGIVHGQVKQSGKFSFTRIYESGHEVPVVSLEMFERVINGLDVATGELNVTSKYLTNGTAQSTYREGNATMQWSVVPTNITYNTTTNQPGAPWAQKRLSRRWTKKGQASRGQRRPVSLSQP
jgi:hypothetical protein